MRWKIALSALMVMGAAGCAQPAGTPPPAAPAPQAEAQQQKQASKCDPGKEEWRSASAPIRGGRYVKVANEFDSLELAGGVRGGASTVASQVYNGLFEQRACYYSDTSVAPVLVKSWQVSPDGLTWTFKLKDNVKWQNKPPVNGRAFTSADVAWLIDYQKTGGGPFKSLWNDVEYQTPDASTVAMKLPKVDADFLARLGHRENVIVPRETKEQYGDYKSVAVGTGAFMVKEIQMGQTLLAERNPNYWEMGKDGKPLPYLDEVRHVFFADFASEVAAFRAGQLDHTRFTGLRMPDVEPMRQALPKSKYHPQLVFSYSALWFNLDKAPFNNVNVRKALALAIEPEDVLASLGGPNAGVYAGFVPPFLDDYAWPEAKIKERAKPNIEQAKKLLADAGVKPDELKPLLKTSSTYRQEAEVVQSQLKAIGINAQIEIEGAIFSPILAQRKFDIAYGVTGGFVFANYWLGDFLRTGETGNVIKLSDPQIDQLIDAQRKELDVNKRRQLLDQMQERLYELMPYRPVVSNYYHHMVSCRVQNYHRVNPSYNTSAVLEAWLDNSAC